MRLIDADEALEELRKAEPKLHIVTCLGFKAVDISAFIQFLENRPTVDAVEVVRCKDCKWWKRFVGHDMGLCVIHDTRMAETDFCSYGEKEKV
jgi:hypothetical protein